MDRYARRYRRPPRRPPECPRLARWTVTFAATARRRSTPECPRLARWIVTFAATRPLGALPNAPASPVDHYVRRYPRRRRRVRMPPASPVDRYVRRYPRRRRQPECHRLARWIVTLPATPATRSILNATGLPGGSLRSPLPPHRGLLSGERETPPGKPMASESPSRACGCSDKRERSPGQLGPWRVARGWGRNPSRLSDGLLGFPVIAPSRITVSC